MSQITNFEKYVLFGLNYVKVVSLKAIPSSDQIAHIFTKALSKAKFKNFRATLVVTDCKYALRGCIKN